MENSSFSFVVMNEQLDIFIVRVFWVLLCVTLLIALYKRVMAKDVIQNDLKVLLIRYFSCFISLFFVAHLQLPYRYQLLLEKGLTNSQISEIFAFSNIFTAIWNLFTPFLLKKFGHASLCIGVALSYFLNSIIYAFGTNYFLLIISGCLQSLTMPTAYMSLMDYWMTEEYLLPPNYNSNYIFNEFRVLTSLIITSISSPMSNAIVKNYGIRSIYSFTFAIPLCSIVIIGYLLHLKNKPEAETITDDFTSMQLYFEAKPANIFLILMDIAFAVSIHIFTHHISAFLFTDSHKPPMGFVQGAYGVMDLIATQIFSQISGTLPSTLWNVLVMIVTCSSMILVYINFNNKLVVFLLIGLTSAMISVTHGVLIQMRKQFYLGKIRNYLITIVKLNTSIVSFFILWYTRRFSTRFYVLWSAIMMGWGAAFSILYYNNTQPNEQQQLQDNELAEELSNEIGVITRESTTEEEESET